MSERAHTSSDERVALYLLGALSHDEASSFESHLEGCERCARELADLRSTAEDLALLAPEASADDTAALKERVLARFRREHRERERTEGPQVWRRWAADPENDVLILGATESGWESTDIEGIETRRLFVDREADRVTMLVRMAPGTSYPAHVHGGPEECLVLEGDIDVGGTVMTAGSFQRKAAGSRHPVQSTKQGCVLMITSSLRDQLTGT